MGWIKEPIRKSEEIFQEIISERPTWNGNYKGNACPYEFWADYIHDYYDVTLKQIDEICKLLREYYKIDKFYYTDMKEYKLSSR